MTRRALRYIPHRLWSGSNPDSLSCLGRVFGASGGVKLHGGSDPGSVGGSRVGGLRAVGRRDQSGFTLVEVVVALAVGAFLLATVVSFFSSTARILQKLKVEREIRDTGLFAVEAVEREFRRTLEYGGRLDEISDTRVVAVLSGSGSARKVSLDFDEASGALELEVYQVSGGVGETATTSWPGGGLKCKSVQVTALVGDDYVEGSNAGALSGRVVVIQFELEDEAYGVSRRFKAAFSAVGGEGL